MAEPRIILHHYPRSPFAEKVRLAFGVKRLRWHSVIQPRQAPKPELAPLTGGYRRIPVMQIGADVYCDTRCILAELDRRFPAPSLHPAEAAGLAEMIAGWADRFLFADGLGLVFGLHGDRFPAELHTDRTRFTAGRFDGWDAAKMKAKLPSLRDHFRAHLAWLDHALGHGRGFLLGDAPTIADLAAYHPLWYARGNLGAEAGIADDGPIAAWMARLDAVGHGEAVPMEPAAALAEARGAEPATGAQADPQDPNGRHPGDRVRVQPDDWGFDPVEGEILRLDAERIALRREDPALGAIVVHFPRAGFVVDPA